MADRTRRPRVYRDLRRDHPGVAVAYADLGDACRASGPLTEREQRLVKLGLSVGLASEEAVRSHVRRALAEGMTPAEVLHAITVAIPTAGLPATIAAYRWATEVIVAVDSGADRWPAEPMSA